MLSENPRQDDIPWREFQWSLSVSCWRMNNNVIRPFFFPIPRCDDAVEGIDTEAHFLYLLIWTVGTGRWCLRKKRGTVYICLPLMASAVGKSCPWEISTQPSPLW